jgi:hypothetical protein
MKSNFDEIKNKINSINVNDSFRDDNVNNSTMNNNKNNISSDSMFSSGMDYNNNFTKSTNRREKNIDDKFEEINAIGERLYEKLIEKVKIKY